MNPALLILLGLSTTAADAEVQARITEWRDGFAKLTALTGKTDLKDAIVEVEAWRTGSIELSKLQQDTAKATDAQKIEEKVREGFMLPAEREYALSLADQDRHFLSKGTKTTLLEGYLATKTTKVAIPTSEGGPKPAPVNHTPSSLAIPNDAELAKLGLTREKYEQTARRMGADGSIQ